MEAFYRVEAASKPTGLRKRGRPVGKARTPLTLDERRARNAQYEKERRMTMADAFVDLANAANIHHRMTPVNLLAEVVILLRTASEKKDPWDADALRRCNNNLATQIATLEHRLATEPELEGCLAPPSPLVEPYMKRKWEESESLSQYPPSKRFAVDQQVPPQYSGLQPPCDSLPLVNGEVTFAEDPFSFSTHQLPCSEPVCQYQSNSTAPHVLLEEEPSTPVSWEWLSSAGSACSQDPVKETPCEELWAEILNASPSSRRFNNDSCTWDVDDLFLDYFVD